MRHRNVLLVDFRSTVCDFDIELRENLIENNFTVTTLNDQLDCKMSITMPRILRVILIFFRVIAYILNYQKSGFIIFCWPPEYMFEFLLARALCWFGDNKTYLITHNYVHHDTKISYLDRPGAKFLNSDTRVVVLSENVYARLSDKISNLVIQCRHPIITRYGYDRYIASSNFKPENTIILGSVGGIRPYKNIALLINFIGLYRKITARDVRLNILGEDRSNIIGRFDVDWLIHDNKRFNDTDLHHFMQGIDVAVFGYKNISQSGAVYLPLAFGTPVFCNCVGDFSELLDIFGDAALKLDLTSFSAFADSMNSLFSKRDNLPEIGKHQSRYAFNARRRHLAFSNLLGDLDA